MPRGTNQKLKIYYLAKILKEKTDDEHRLTRAEIVKYLEEYDVTVNRKTLYNDIEALRIMGIDVIGEWDGRNYYYHVGKKDFELAELKLLVDVIQASKFLTEKKSRNLIKKINGLASEYEAKQLKRQVVIQGRVKAVNERIYYNVDALHGAIANNSSIKFEYLQWDLNKKLVPKKDQLYEVSPWALSWDYENYYMIAYDYVEEKIKHYRVDKMRNIEMTGKMREGREHFKKFDLAAYTKKNFGMYGGEDREVKIRFANAFVGVILDRFGKNIAIIPTEEEGWSETYVKVAISDQFFGWIFSLGNNVKLAGPDDVVDRFRTELDSMIDMYGGKL